MKTPLLQGRTFETRDSAPQAPHTAILNEAAAEMLGLGGDVVGRSFWVEQTSFEPRTRYEILGVVANSKYRDLREAFRPTFFVPMSEVALTRNVGSFMIRSRAASTEALGDEMRAALSGADPAIRFSLQSLSDIGNELLGREKMMVTASTPLAALAIFLAGLGLYGVTAQSVAERRSEIGIRIALGATNRRVVAMIVRESAVAAAVGIIVGSAFALYFGSSLASLLYDLSPSDPWTLAATAGTLGAVTIVAGYFPARRAVIIDPVRSLRRE